jgi:hypothetical protein
MPQLLLQGFPDGAIRIGATVSVLKKEGRITYFVGSDNYLWHAEGDEAGLRLSIATLIANRHVRASEVATSALADSGQNGHRFRDQTGQFVGA